MERFRRFLLAISSVINVNYTGTRQAPAPLALFRALFRKEPETSWPVPVFLAQRDLTPYFCPSASWAAGSLPNRADSRQKPSNPAGVTMITALATEAV